MKKQEYSKQGFSKPRKAAPGSPKAGIKGSPKSGAPASPYARKAESAGTGPVREERKRPDTRTEVRAGKPAAKFPIPRPAVTGKEEFGARVSRRASERLRDGHLWVYATDIEALNAGDGEAPALLPVADNRGLLLGTALYSPASQIALRMVSREAIGQAQWLDRMAARMRTAIARRRPLLDAETNACRLVFAEADDLPGLVVDKYAGLAIVQLLSKGLDSAQVREVCARVLREELGTVGPLTIWERPDPRIRELEGLSAPSTGPLFAADVEAPETSVLFRLNGLQFHFDVGSGQKTGAFLDQRENYAAAENWARRRGAKKALDVCTYQGGFALHLARVCERVTGIDASRASLETAERNLETNRTGNDPRLKAEVDWVEADAFELLRGWSESKENSDFDMIVLDPPAFAKSKRAVEGALRGYKELNLRALRMIRPGGLLVTFSCSHHVGWSELELAVASAAVDAGKRVTLLERRGAALDHPVVLNLPETEYLKCLVCQVD